jgi:hypothetical protein
MLLVEVVVEAKIRVLLVLVLISAVLRFYRHVPFLKILSNTFQYITETLLLSPSPLLLVEISWKIEKQGKI